MVSTAEKIAAGFKTSTEGITRFQVECAGELAGAIIVVCPWLAGPYLQMLAIQPTHQTLASAQGSSRGTKARRALVPKCLAMRQRFQCRRAAFLPSARLYTVAEPSMV